MFLVFQVKKSKTEMTACSPGVNVQCPLEWCYRGTSPTVQANSHLVVEMCSHPVMSCSESGLVGLKKEHHEGCAAKEN